MNTLAKKTADKAGRGGHPAKSGHGRRPAEEQLDLFERCHGLNDPYRTREVVRQWLIAGGETGDLFTGLSPLVEEIVANGTHGVVADIDFSQWMEGRRQSIAVGNDQYQRQIDLFGHAVAVAP